jgi:PhoH-like ATPase
MYNKNIPIKIICGGYGAGKTMIAVKCAENMVNKCFYNKLMLVRNPIPADDIDIGALPGDKHSKVGSYFKSMTQYLTDYSNGLEIDSFDPNNEYAAKQRGYELIMEIPSFMKGMSVLDTIMIVDECEDLNVKLIKMLGTRVGKNSCVVFTGDYHQSEKKYKADSGMNKMIECLKGDPLVGIIVLEEDVRSSVSKLFANID